MSFDDGLYSYTVQTHTHTYIYIYIYMYTILYNHVLTCTYIYIYVYNHMLMHDCIILYTYMWTYEIFIKFIMCLLFAESCAIPRKVRPSYPVARRWTTHRCDEFRRAFGAGGCCADGAAAPGGSSGDVPWTKDGVGISEWRTTSMYVYIHMYIYISSRTILFHTTIYYSNIVYIYIYTVYVVTIDISYTDLSI